MSSQRSRALAADRYRLGLVVVVLASTVGCAASGGSTASLEASSATSPSPAASEAASPRPSPQPSSSPSPSPDPSPACSIALDGEPAWDVRFYVNGIGFAPGAEIRITVDEPKELWTWPGTLEARADGSFGPFDLMYSQPVAGDGGEYVFRASDGGCTASAAFTLPEP